MTDASRSPAALLLLAAVLAAAGPAVAQGLSYEEIVRRLPGSWEIDPASPPETTVPFYRADTFACDKSPAMVRIIREASGDFYSAQRADGEVTVVRAPLQPFEDAAGIGLDGASHRAPIIWKFLMPDTDHLSIINVDNPAPRPLLRRCADGPIA